MRHLLIDGDLIAYRATSVNQSEYDWGDGVTSTVANLPAAKALARQQIEALMDHLNGHSFTVILSDDFNNFRKEIDPTYKGNRTSERPEHLYEVKDWLYGRYPSDRRGWLEADDVMGILASEPGTGEDRIMVSDDKDMKTIPGLLYRPNIEGHEVEQITVEAADRFHLWQTVTGDQTDGYPGAPGMGPKAANAALDDLTGFRSYVHTFTRGPRKGTSEVRWEPDRFPTRWAAIVSLFEKAGKDESFAIRQARLARILRHGEWNGRPILWSPETHL